MPEAGTIKCLLLKLGKCRRIRATTKSVEVIKGIFTRILIPDFQRKEVYKRILKSISNRTQDRGIYKKTGNIVRHFKNIGKHKYLVVKLLLLRKFVFEKLLF